MDHVENQAPITSRTFLGSLVRHQFEGFRQKSISSQDGDRFSKCLVTGGFTPPIVIIVDGRKIIMNERISVDHLQGTGKRENPAPLSSYRFEDSYG
jgi:hypothetical protein